MGAAARAGHRIRTQRRIRFPQDIEIQPVFISDALQDAAEQRPCPVLPAKAQPSSPHLWHARAGAPSEVGQEQQAAASRRGPRCRLVQFLVSQGAELSVPVQAHPAPADIRQGVPQPIRRRTGKEQGFMPQIGGVSIGHAGEDRGGTRHVVHFALPKHPGPQRGGCRIPAARRHRYPRRQAAGRGHLLGQRPDSFGGPADGRHFLRRHLEGPEKPLVPPAVRIVGKAGEMQMGVVDVRVPGRQAAQPHPHIGGRRHKPGDPGVGLRPFALPPKDFRPVVHRHLPAGQADHRLLCRLLHGADIRRAAGIQPGVVRRNRHPISADTKNPRHLGVHPHRGDLIRGYSALFQHGADGAADAAQHLLWSLRDGAGLRMEQDGRLKAVGQQGPVRRVYGRFSALGANVATDETGSHTPAS